jgi:hypothetical protein
MLDCCCVVFAVDDPNARVVGGAGVFIDEKPEVAPPPNVLVDEVDDENPVEKEGIGLFDAEEVAALVFVVAPNWKPPPPVFVLLLLVLPKGVVCVATGVAAFDAPNIKVEFEPPNVGVGVGVLAAEFCCCSIGFKGSGLLVVVELVLNLNPPEEVVVLALVFELLEVAPKLNPPVLDDPDENEEAAVVADGKKLVEPKVIGLLLPFSLDDDTIDGLFKPKLIFEEGAGRAALEAAARLANKSWL